MFLVIFMIGLGLTYMVLILLSQKPERAVYGFLLNWLLFPKYISWLPVLGSMPTAGWRPFDIAEISTAFTLLLVCLFKRPNLRWRGQGWYHSYLFAFFIMAVISFIAGNYFTNWSEITATKYTADITYLNYSRAALAPVYGALFAWGCLLFITTQKQVETIFLLFVISGIELTIEAVFLYYLRLVPALEPWVVDTGSAIRFNSLTFLAFDTVGLVGIIAISFAMYFALVRRSVLIWALLPVMFLPIVGTLGKAPLTGALLAVIAVVLFNLRRRWLPIAAVAMFAVWIPLATLDADVMMGSLNERLGRQSREELMSAGEAFYGRVALWLRGADIFLSHFPMGVGNGLVEYQMAQDTPPHFMDLTRGDMRRAYEHQVLTDHVTNSHNIVVEFVTENGLFGLALAAAYLSTFLGLFRNFMMRPRPTKGTAAWRARVAQGALYGCALGVAWRCLYEVQPKIYFLFLSILVLSFVLAEIEKREGLLAADPQRPSPLMSRGHVG